MREISIIKEKILQFLEYKGVSKYEFYQKTGVSNGILSQKNGISEDNLLKFLSVFNDISLDWLLLGKGTMLRESVENSGGKPESPPDTGLVLELTRQISELSRENGQLQAENAELKKELARSEAAAAASARTA